jgi:hypothetical protein
MELLRMNVGRVAPFTPIPLDEAIALCDAPYAEAVARLMAPALATA